MLLVYFALAWIAGTVAGREWAFPAELWVMLGALGMVGALAAWQSSHGRRGAVLLVAFALGGGRYVLAQPALDANHLAAYNDRGGVTVRGIVSAEPSVRGTYTQLEVAAEETALADTRRAVRGKLVVNVPHYPAYEYGDLLSLSGLLETPPVLDDFSYKEYLAARGVHSLMRRAQVTDLHASRGNPLLRAMLRLKRSLRLTLERILPQPEAGLLSGILLGQSHTLPNDLADAFRAVGLTHILVISGFNISLVIQAVMVSSQRALSRWTALWVSWAAILLYAVGVGLSAPVARAVLMGSLVIAGQLVGRRSHALTSLAWASLVMVLADPLILWSVSFQLSFAATLALIVIEPHLAQGLQAGLARWAGTDRATAWTTTLRDALLATVAAQMCTLPLIWYHFREVSLISLLANALVLPVQPALMALGGVALALGALWLPIGQGAAWLAWPWLRYTTAVVQGLARLPWAAVTVPPLGIGSVVGLYALLGLGLAAGRLKELSVNVRGLLGQRRAIQALMLGLALGAVLVWAAALTLPDGRLHIYFLDVGQGDAILLRTPGGRTLLVDGGADPLLLTSRLGRILPFWQRQIDLVVATHADQDHLAGLVGLAERYRVARVLEAPVMTPNALTTQWRKALAASGAEVFRATRGMRITLGEGLRLEVLHPPGGTSPTVATDDNQNAVLLQLVAGRCRVLLMADSDAQVEESLLAVGQPLAATILKVAHHGAATGTSVRFLAAVNPQVAVVSVGADNRFGHPSAETLGRLAAAGCQVYRTDQQGTIEVVTDGRAYWVKPQGAARK